MTDQPAPLAVVTSGGPNVYDAARHILELAAEPDGLSRIRAVLFAVHDAAVEEGREEIREQVREVALQRANLSEQRAQIGRSHLPHDPNRAAGEITWAASLADQAGALRSVLG